MRYVCLHVQVLSKDNITKYEDVLYHIRNTEDMQRSAGTDVEANRPGYAKSIRGLTLRNYTSPEYVNYLNTIFGNPTETLTKELTIHFRASSHECYAYCGTDRART